MPDEEVYLEASRAQARVWKYDHTLDPEAFEKLCVAFAEVDSHRAVVDSAFAAGLRMGAECRAEVVERLKAMARAQDFHAERGLYDNVPTTSVTDLHRLSCVAMSAAFMQAARIVEEADCDSDDA